MTAELTDSQAPIDLASFDLEGEHERGATMQLLAPRDDKASGLKRAQPTGIEFHVLGDESPTFRRNIRQMIDEVQMKLENEPKDPDTVEKLARARTAACSVTGWTGKVVLDGKSLDYTRDNAAMLFYERPWIARQVENFRTNVGNFEPR